MKFRDGIKSTGKVLIYSDFRGDSGGEVVEQSIDCEWIQSIMIQLNHP